MEYTVQKLAQMAGISTRTIRYYDEIDLLKPVRINTNGYRIYKALEDHRMQLLERKRQIDELLENVEKTIKEKQGGVKMSDQEKFAGFKNAMIQKNESKYGQEIREKYGDEVVDQSNAKLQGMTREDYDRITKLGEEVIKTLKYAFATGDPAGELGQKAADLHRQWLSFYWREYSSEAHASIVEMYVSDQRFKDYYDQYQPGLAKFLRDAVLVYTVKTKE